MRIWKLLAAPFSIDATVPPAYSEQQLDALVEALQMQEARIYMPREKTHFQSFDLKRHYPSAKRSIAYALTSVTVSRDTPVAMQVRTANSMRVWINGDLVLAHIAPASGRAATTSADLVLEKGENVILVECMQDATTWGFSMGLSVPEQAAGREQKRVASPAPGR
ncbi:MAG: hypothetical protein NZ557_16070 [Chthonomonadaceae bacterium]|nr:hypothetical protein [Chthonomonadaceae bacterium]